MWSTSLTYLFIVNALGLICPETRTRDGLMAVLIEELFAKYEAAFNHARFLLDVERMRTPATLNHYFNENLEERLALFFPPTVFLADIHVRSGRRDRTHATLKEKSIDDHGQGWMVCLDDIVQNHPMSNVKHIVQEIHDILESYYKVARKPFVDNLCMQAVGYHLVRTRHASETFLAIFHQQLVGGAVWRDVRRRCNFEKKTYGSNKEIKDLEAGKKILT